MRINVMEYYAAELVPVVGAINHYGVRIYYNQCPVLPAYQPAETPEGLTAAEAYARRAVYDLALLVESRCARRLAETGGVWHVVERHRGHANRPELSVLSDEGFRSLPAPLCINDPQPRIVATFPAPGDESQAEVTHG